MGAAETFDAFYARTVSSVTSQIHALANGDVQADHAIREAYARAYQQWFEVSGYRDTESWVLDVAKEAFERRRAQTAPAAQSDRDSGSWPGIFRQRKPAAGPGAPADPAATIAPARPADPFSGRASPFMASAMDAGQVQAGPARGSTAYIAGMPGDTAGTRPARHAPGSQRWPGGAKGRIAAIVAVAAVAAGAAAYLAYGAFSASQGGNTGAGAKTGTNSAVQMLPAGQVGTRAQVPWSLVAPGWALAELSTAPAGAAGPAAGGQSTIFLVDPQGGRYAMQSWPGSTAPTVLAWSGDASSALLGSGATAGGTGAGTYAVLTLSTGQVTPLTLPANVTVTGFTRPRGLNLLAVQQGPGRYRLERYSLQGSLQAVLATIRRSPIMPAWLGGGCGADCGAVSSPDGKVAVWGARAGQMQLVDNAGGVIRRLPVPNSGPAPSCAPISWWDTGTVLATCTSSASQASSQSGPDQLWLVPENGSSPQPLTVPAGSASDTGAWQAGGQQYITQTTAQQCSSTPTGPGGMEIRRLTSSGSTVPVPVAGSTGNHNAIVGSAGARLLVLAQTSCPGTSALLWVTPATGATQTALSANSSAMGVVAAVPYGAGTPAAGN